MAKKKRTFSVEVSAYLYVRAFDAASAQKKASAVFRERRSLGADVHVGGAAQTATPVLVS